MAESSTPLVHQVFEFPCQERTARAYVKRQLLDFRSRAAQDTACFYLVTVNYPVNTFPGK